MSFFCLRHKNLVWNMVSRNIKLRYRKSFLGYIWTLLTPLSTAAIYYFLFKVIFRVQVPDFAAFIATGILVWSFFSSTLSEGMSSVMSGFSILLQVNVPINAFPLTTAITNLITLIFAIPVIIGICLVSGINIQASFFMLVPYLLMLFFQAYGLAVVLSVAVIYVRDLKQAIGPLTQIWMYGTPILYQVNLIPERYTWILYANPVGKIFGGIHNCVLRGAWPTYAEVIGPLLWTVVILVAAYIVSAKVSKGALEKI